MSDQKLYTSRLAGQRVLIFGGTSGIGYCVAEASVESGAEVILCSSNSTRMANALQRLMTAYPSATPRITGEVCDLGQPSLEADLRDLLTRVGAVNHIVFTAGDALRIRPLSETSLSDLQTAGQVRAHAPVLIAKYAHLSLEKNARSSFTITSGAVSERPRPGWTVAAFNAGGLLTLTRQLALEMAPIRVNVVVPGAVETELWESLPEGHREMIKQQVRAQNLTKEIGAPQDVAEAYLYCMKDSNLTGASISSNGGGVLV